MNNGNIMVVQSLKYIGELLFDIKGKYLSNYLGFSLESRPFCDILSTGA